ncbi:DUF3231 family protein [Lentibacillus sp. CBA3610]|uniref:DUF3231 family protein n=1 Tax=Lentibacillus sp. CBA3610 TaxID=2518176 RepID=UPI001595FF69|nr:DUF3231 family protein [Lentibacillus sp. CBA3610]QKY68850.1 DUF3231 family protein [Lentibacillus sp. CBA3610]
MDSAKNVKLTSSEITQLWTTYMNENVNICQLEYFLAKVEDEEIKPIVQYFLELTQTHIRKITALFNKEKYPVPYGFKMEEDVDITAPRLYSDTFILHYLHTMGGFVLQAYAVGVQLAVRADIYSFFTECLEEATEILREMRELLLSKGIFIRTPNLPIPESYDFVKNKSFLTGYFGERRPLTGTEITNLNMNYQRNALGTAVMIGFSQVAQSKEVRQFLVRGKEIAQKHCEVFSSILVEDDIPVPMTWNTEVTDSTAFTFSDKLMMFLTTALIGLSVGFYGTSMSMSPRRDLGTQYSRLSGEIVKFAEDGANIMIKNGWMEEPPRALDRDELAKKK